MALTRTKVEVAPATFEEHQAALAAQKEAAQSVIRGALDDLRSAENSHGALVDTLAAEIDRLRLLRSASLAEVDSISATTDAMSTILDGRRE